MLIIAWERLKLEMNRVGLSPEDQELIKKEISHLERNLRRESRTKISVRDFSPIKIIGKGAFGEVRLVRAKGTSEILAMKKMKKSEMIAKRQVQHIRADRKSVV